MIAPELEALLRPAAQILADCLGMRAANPRDVQRSAAMLESCIRSWQREMEARVFFPSYPAQDGQPWWMHPNREAVKATLTDGGTVSLFEAAVLIGDRVLSDPAALIADPQELSTLVVCAWLHGEIDPRRPGALVRYSDHPGEVPNLAWELYPNEVDAFALKRWGSAVFASEAPSAGRSAEAPSAGRSPDLRYREAYRLAAECRANGMKKAAAIAQAVEQAYPDATESERTRAASRLNDDLKPSKTPAWANLPTPRGP